MCDYFSVDDLYKLEELVNDSIFANRKRLQHAQGKINLNVPGFDGIREDSVEECQAQLELAEMWYDKVYQIRCNAETLLQNAKRG